MMGHNGGNQNRLFYSFNLPIICFAASISFSTSPICAPISPRFTAIPADHRSIRNS
jgi:hypothetical protein